MGRPRTCWCIPTRQGVRLRSLFRLSSVIADVACPSDANCFTLCPFSFGSADLTLLAGDFVPGFYDCPERAGPQRVLVQTNSRGEETSQDLAVGAGTVWRKIDETDADSFIKVQPMNTIVVNNQDRRTA